MTARKRRLEARKAPVQRRSRATVEHILMAAAQVFERHGYAAGTTNRIAARAGVSVGTLYQYFPSKDAIAVALLEGHVAATEERLRQWVEHMVGEQHGLRPALRDYVEGMLAAHSGRPRLQHILLEETPLPERVHAALLEMERQAARAVAEVLGSRLGVAHPQLERAGYVVVQTVESLTHRFAAHPEMQAMPTDAFVEEVVAMLEAYLASRVISPG